MTTKTVMAATAALALVGFLFAWPASADTFVPSHHCSKPYKPFSIESEWEVEAYARKVKAYGRCISDFVEEQSEAAERHRSAARDAIDEWNRFIH